MFAMDTNERFKAENKGFPPDSEELLGRARFDFLETVVQGLHVVHTGVFDLPGSEFVEPFAGYLSAERSVYVGNGFASFFLTVKEG